MKTCIFGSVKSALLIPLIFSFLTSSLVLVISIDNDDVELAQDPMRAGVIKVHAIRTKDKYVW
jgi:hypothetical protein